jgi:hypothetical protein
MSRSEGERGKFLPFLTNRRENAGARDEIFDERGATLTTT